MYLTLLQYSLIKPQSTHQPVEMCCNRHWHETLFSHRIQLMDWSQMCSGCCDWQEVLLLIHRALNIYDADKTGRVDFALESAGLWNLMLHTQYPDYWRIFASNYNVKWVNFSILYQHIVGHSVLIIMLSLCHSITRSISWWMSVVSSYWHCKLTTTAM